MKTADMLIPILAVSALAAFAAALAAVYRGGEDFARLSAQYPPEKAEAAVVLGNTVNRRGRPNPCLRSRVEAGVWLYRAAKADVLLMSGGTDADGSNQAETMRDMAVDLGVPAQKVWVENRSQSTYQNLKFSTPLLAGTHSLIIVSDGFHLPRSLWLARRRWPDKHLQAFAARDCGDSAALMWRKRVREVLAWGKALLLDRN